MNSLINNWKCNTVYSEMTSVIYGNMSYFLKSSSKIYSNYKISNLLPLHRISISNGYSIRNNDRFIDKLISEYTEAVITEDINNNWTRIR